MTVSPAPNANGGPVTISLTVSDGSASSTETFNVTVTPVNDAPTISSIANRTIPEDTSMPATPFTVNDVETNPNSLTVTATSNNPFLVTNDRIILGGSGTARTVAVNPIVSRQGTATITLTVSDGTGGTNSTSFALTVTGDDDPPIISPIADRNIPNGTTSQVLFTVTDDIKPSSQVFVGAFSSDETIIKNTNLVVLPSGDNRTLNITPTKSGGPVVITILASDGVNNTTEQFTVNVVASAPNITAIPDQVINEDSTTSALPFTIGDPDTPVGSLVVTVASNNQAIVPNANVVLAGTGANRTVTVTPAANANGGPVVITVSVSDGTSIVTETFDVTVTPINDPPVVSAIADITINEDSSTGPLAFTVADIDTSLDLLTITATSNNQVLVPNANIVLGGSAANRTVTVTPAPNANGGPATITVIVSDGVASVTETFDVTVTPVNDLPTISPIADVITNEDTPTGPLAFTLSDIDTPLDSLVVTATSNNQALVPNANIVLAGTGANRTVNVTPALNVHGGPVTITVTVNDGPSSVTETFDVTVTPVNDRPTISAIADVTIFEDTSTGPISFTIGDVDTPVDALTVTATSNNQALVPDANIVLAGTGANRTVTVTPAANANGLVTITLTVSDVSASVTETFSVTVTAGQRSDPRSRPSRMSPSTKTPRPDRWPSRSATSTRHWIRWWSPRPPTIRHSCPTPTSCLPAVAQIAR